MSGTLILFDIDGTLMRGAGPDHKEALLAGIRSVTGMTADFEDIDTSGRLDMDLIALLLESIGVSATPSALKEIARESQRAYIQNCRKDLRPFVCKGAREVLEQLSQRGATLALVTGNLSAIGWRKMELAHLRDFFAHGAFSEDGATRADLARIAMARAPEAARVALVGDHRNDVEAAKLNGICSIAVATGPMPADELRSHKPDIFLETLADLNLDLLFE